MNMPTTGRAGYLTRLTAYNALTPAQRKQAQQARRAGNKAFAAAYSPTGKLGPAIAAYKAAAAGQH